MARAMVVTLQQQHTIYRNNHQLSHFGLSCECSGVTTKEQDQAGDEHLRIDGSFQGPLAEKLRNHLMEKGSTP